MGRCKLSVACSPAMVDSGLQLLSTHVHMHALGDGMLATAALRSGLGAAAHGLELASARLSRDRWSSTHPLGQLPAPLGLCAGDGGAQSDGAPLRGVLRCIPGKRSTCATDLSVPLHQRLRSATADRLPPPPLLRRLQAVFSHLDEEYVVEPLGSEEEAALVCDALTSERN